MPHLTMFQWMSVNVDRLVAAIIEDGKYDGPKSGPLLFECYGCRMGSASELDRSKRLLKMKLGDAGHAQLMPT